VIDYKDPVFPAFLIGIIQDFKYDEEYDSQDGKDQSEQPEVVIGQ
jgi:hypothetical protein